MAKPQAGFSDHVDKPTIVFLPKHFNEPNTSWWLNTRDFYDNARVREPFMRSSRFGSLPQATTTSSED